MTYVESKKINNANIISNIKKIIQSIKKQNLCAYFKNSLITNLNKIIQCIP